MRAIVRVIAAVVIMMMVVVVPARADNATGLSVLAVDGRTVELLMTFDPQQVTESATATATVEIDGQKLPATARFDATGTAPATAVLVLDASGSMAGSRLATAQKAATDFVTGLPKDANVALVSFGDTINVLAEPTKDRAAVLDAIKGIKAGGSTALYDAVESGLARAPSGTAARVVVLSDGQDTISKAKLTDLEAKAKAAGVPIDVIAIRPTTDQLGKLRAISDSSGGQVRTASTSADLITAFSSALKAFGSQAYLTVDVPPTLNASGKDVTASLDMGGTVLTHSVTLPVAQSLAADLSATTADTAKTSTVISATSVVTPQPPRQWIPLLMSLIVAAAVLLIGLLVMRVRRQARARRRIDQVLFYRPSPGPRSGTDASQQPPSGLLGSLDVALARRSGYRATRNGLAAAGVGFTPASWLVLRVVVVVALALLLTVALGNALLGLLLGGVLGWLVTRIWLRSRATKRRDVFANELPDFLQLLASGLRAGLSFNSALESAAMQGKGEVGRQMRRALGEVQLGAQLDAALSECADRMENDDLRWTVTALSIQREVGGNLSTILDTAAGTIKARHELQREVRTLSAEGRLSAYVLVALPLGVFGFLLVFRREYVSLLWADPIGLVMLGAVVVLIGLGWFWMRAIVRIKV